jgi:hypothetical protein
VNKSFTLVLLLCLTLGLAPFYPEPHLFGKIKWLIGGGVGMKGQDWFDLILHGTPWLILFYMVLSKRWKKT